MRSRDAIFWWENVYAGINKFLILEVTY